MNALRLQFICDKVECTDGFIYPLTDRLELCFLCHDNPHYISKTRTETAYNKETQEKYNLISVYFGVNYTDCITFAVNYMKPAIYPDKITNAN